MKLKFNRGRMIGETNRRKMPHPGEQSALTRGGGLSMCLFALAGISNTALGQTSLFVPNASFESQVAGPPLYVDTRIDSWQKPDKPDYFDEAAFGFLWDQTAGAFFDTNPYGNRDGSQAAYLLSFPEVALFQDDDTVDWDDTAPTHDFDEVFQPGNSYTLTVALFGKDMPDGASLELSLYYRDGSNSMTTVGSTTVVYSAASFPETPPLNLVDYEVNVATVQPGDDWAGQNIGIKIESTVGTGAGYWDIDRVRLTTIPEPASLSLLSIVFGGVWVRRVRARRES